VFRNATSLIYLTDEEKALVEGKFGVENLPNIITGAGVDVPDKASLFDAKAKYGLGDYILYVGRIDESKGCARLFQYFDEYKKRNGMPELKLVLCGKAVLDIPKRADIVPMGFVTDEEKFSLIKDCKVLVLASEFESLSMVVLEAMTYNRPVLVNGKCKVLRGHCRKSNAGLYFEDYFEFEGALNYMLKNEDGYAKLCVGGSRYVDENYRWDVIVGKIKGLVDMY
jgi:glycosyltransferase involved in cell wall biosynthesis